MVPANSNGASPTPPYSGYYLSPMTSLTRYHVFNMVGCPIRTSADQFLFADPRSFSQLITSFFASESLGIPHTLFITSF